MYVQYIKYYWAHDIDKCNIRHTYTSNSTKGRVGAKL